MLELSLEPLLELMLLLMMLMMAPMLGLMVALMMPLMLILNEKLRLQLEVCVVGLDVCTGMHIDSEDVKSSCEKETERLFGVSDRPSSRLMVESMIVPVGCFLFATTDGRSLALIAILAIVFEHFPEGRIEGVDVADVAASAVEKVSDSGPNDTAAAE